MKTNNNKVVIVLLIIIIAILSTLCVLFATGTITFKSNSVDNGNVTENNNNKNSNSNTEVTNKLDNNVKTELESTFKFVYNYYDTGNGYCGSYLEGDTIAGDGKANWYTASSKYSSFDNMITDLKQYMTEDVIYEKHSMKRENYIEKNAKLYCPNYGKGGNIYQLKDIEITTNNITDNNVNTTIKAKLVYENETVYNTYNVNFSKNNQGKWLVSLYEKKPN